MATTVQSRKQKGRKAQQYIRDSLLTAFPDLTVNDIMSTSMGVSGEDLKLSEQARRVIGNFDIESKACESFNIWGALKQCEERCGEKIPLVVFKRNRSTVYCSLKLSDFIDILKSRRLS